MKKLAAKAGVLVASAVALVGVSTPAHSDQAGISNASENSPLYLDHAPTSISNAQGVLNYHYSHSSHESHVSHQSHQSGY